jgi:hypothetical protein
MKLLARGMNLYFDVSPMPPLAELQLGRHETCWSKVVMTKKRDGYEMQLFATRERERSKAEPTEKKDWKEGSLQKIFGGTTRLKFLLFVAGAELEVSPVFRLNPITHRSDRSHHTPHFPLL